MNPVQYLTIIPNVNLRTQVDRWACFTVSSVRLGSFDRIGWSQACFGWWQGVFAVTGGSCALKHRDDHNQTAAATGPQRERVGMRAAMLHVISLSTLRVVAGLPIRPAIRVRALGC